MSVFQLKTFGGLWLERDRTRVEGTSTRRLGLLAAVAAAGDRGVSRDRLLLLLWPDSTEAKARHALAQTLYSLRRELATDLVRSEPAGLLIHPANLGSDLAEFLGAIDRGEPDHAAALYTGPFLDGFYIQDADEFERWAEVERARLRELAIQALEAAARQATGAGRLQDAAAYWRRLGLLAPLNSRIIAEYMAALVESGDAAGAIQIGRSHQLACRQELGTRPDPAIEVLMGRLAQGEGRSVLPVSGIPAKSADSTLIAGSAASPQGDWDQSARRVQWQWTRRLPLALSLLGLSALALWRFTPLFDRNLDFPAGSLVVMADPVDLSGDPSLGRALASAAAVALQQSHHVALLPRSRVAAALQRMGRIGDSVLTDSLALEVAARENARAVFSLRVVHVTEGYDLTGRLLSPGDGRDLAAHHISVARLDDVLGGLDRLLRKIQASAGDPRRYRDSLPTLPLVTTASLEALKLYAEANESWRRARYSEAERLFARAVAIDTQFALAHSALGAYYYYINERPAGDAHLAQAERYRDRLTFREQLDLESRLATARGDREAASRVDHLIAERYPTSETWYAYGTALLQQNLCVAGISALKRALALDSRNVRAHINLATCYKDLGENRLALDAYAAAEKIDSTALLNNNINLEWGAVLVRLGRYEEAEAIFRRMLNSAEASDQAQGHRSLAYLAELRGRYRDAIGDLSAAVALTRSAATGTSFLRNEALLAEAYLVRGMPALAARELDSALALAGRQFVEPGFLALLGRVLVRSGRLADARRILARIERTLKQSDPTDRSARGLLFAELALARGTPEAAFGAIRNDKDPTLGKWRLSLAGRVFAERGLTDSALAATAAFALDEHFGWDIQTEWLLAPMQVARLAEALGDSATARAALQTLLNRWRDGDADLPVVLGARRDLARLQRGGAR